MIVDLFGVTGLGSSPPTCVRLQAGEGHAGLVVGMTEGARGTGLTPPGLGLGG